MPRITDLHITVPDLVQALTGGNPGALSVCTLILKDGAKIDPDSAEGGFMPLLLMDTFEIYDGDIWLLYKDICGMDIVKLLAVLRACQMGGLADCTQASIKQSLQFVGRGIKVQLDLDAILEAVQEKVPQFGKNV